jgi:glucose uptake protein GlcU
MSEPSSRPSFGQIYRQQYREMSSSSTSKAFRVIRPLTLAICVLLGVLFHHSVVIDIILGALAVLVLAGTVIWSRTHRRGEAQ